MQVSVSGLYVVELRDSNILFYSSQPLKVLRCNAGVVIIFHCALYMSGLSVTVRLNAVYTMYPWPIRWKRLFCWISTLGAVKQRWQQMWLSIFKDSDLYSDNIQLWTQIVFFLMFPYSIDGLLYVLTNESLLLSRLGDNSLP